MKPILLATAVFLTGPAVAQTKGVVSQRPVYPAQTLSQPGEISSNPWISVPPTTPYRKLAEEIKAGTQPGQPSALNPSCEGKKGDECVRSEERPNR